MSNLNSQVWATIYNIGRLADFTGLKSLSLLLQCPDVKL